MTDAHPSHHKKQAGCSGIHPDKTAYRAVDACGGIFPRAKNDYDSGFQAGHDAALSAAMDAVRPVDVLITELLEALMVFAKCADELDGFPEDGIEPAPNGEWAKFRLLTDDYRRARAAVAKAMEPSQ